MELRDATIEELKTELLRREVTLRLSRPEYKLLMSFFKGPLTKYMEDRNARGPDGDKAFQDQDIIFGRLIEKLIAVEPPRDTNLADLLKP